MAAQQPGKPQNIELMIHQNPFITKDVVHQVMKLFFNGPMPIERIIIAEDFQKELLSNLRETEKAKYIMGVIPYPRAETVIPGNDEEQFKIIINAKGYKEEFHAYLGLIHEFCHVRDFDLYFKKYGYIHTKPLSMLRRLNYPEFLIWSEYISVKNSFEYCVEFFGSQHPDHTISLEIDLEVPEMHKLYHEMIAEEKKDPRFADAVKLETAVMLERFLKVYFAANIAKIELNNSSFKDLVNNEKLEADSVLELRHFIFDEELKELGKILGESNSFDSAVYRFKNMAICYNNIIEKLKNII